MARGDIVNMKLWNKREYFGIVPDASTMKIIEWKQKEVIFTNR